MESGQQGQYIESMSTREPLNPPIFSDIIKLGWRDLVESVVSITNTKWRQALAHFFSFGQFTSNVFIDALPRRARNTNSWQHKSPFDVFSGIELFSVCSTLRGFRTWRHFIGFIGRRLITMFVLRYLKNDFVIKQIMVYGLVHLFL